MPDGSSSERRTGRICESGDYFCKRDRNKAGTISIYTCKGRQTVPVHRTDECAPEGQKIDAEQLGRIELALASFIKTNLEAAARERAGIIKRDLFVKECVNIYAVARDAFMEQAVKRVRESLAEAEDANEDHELISALRDQVTSAVDAARKERDLSRLLIKNVEATWKKAGPTVSQMEQPEQMNFINAMRNIGYADSSIERLLGRLVSSMHHCDAETRLLMKVPPRIPSEKWKITTDEDEESVGAYEPEELAALFNAAAKHEASWRYLNMATHGARPMTIIETRWLQITLDETPRWKLNPPGKRRTKKRRPKIPICHTLAAEMKSWKRDNGRIVTNGQGQALTRQTKMFERLKRRAGIKHGSPMSVRKCVRTWLAVHGVPDVIADWFVGHAEEGSVTGRKFYKQKKADYMKAAADAIEELYDYLRQHVTRPFAGGPVVTITEDQPPLHDEAIQTILATFLRGNRVANIAVSS